MASKKKDDNFETLIKSLKPIQFKLSHESQKWDSYFKNLNIESINKTLHPKLKPPLKYKDSLLHKNVIYSYKIHDDYYEYFENSNGEKKIPLKIEKKLINKVQKFQKEKLLKKYEELFFNNNKEEEKNVKPKKLIQHHKVINRPLFGLDPGHYYPNYNAIKKRIPCFDFSKINNSNISKDKEKNNENIKNKIKQNITEENKKTENNEIKNEKIDLYNSKIKNAKMNNIFIKLNLSQHIKNNSPKIISRNPKNNNNYFPQIKSSKEKIPKTKSIIKTYISHSKLRKIFSTQNIISFKKMSGRNNESKRSHKISSSKDYHPNYESNKPHIPSYIFKKSLDEKNYKKFKIGKLIRSYNYDPYKYYAMDNSQNKNSCDISKICSKRNKSKEIKGYNYK